MSKEGSASWEASLYRRILRLFPGRVSRAYEADMVELFEDRLREIGPTRRKRVALLFRGLLDALRHGTGTWLDFRGGPVGSGSRSGGRDPGGLESVAHDVRFASGPSKGVLFSPPWPWRHWA